MRFDLWRPARPVRGRPRLLPVRAAADGGAAPQGVRAGRLSSASRPALWNLVAECNASRCGPRRGALACGAGPAPPSRGAHRDGDRRLDDAGGGQHPDSAVPETALGDRLRPEPVSRHGPRRRWWSNWRCRGRSSRSRSSTFVLLGVEIGGILIVAVLFPLLFLVGRLTLYRKVLLPLAATGLILVSGVSGDEAGVPRHRHPDAGAVPARRPEGASVTVSTGRPVFLRAGW